MLAKKYRLTKEKDFKKVYQRGRCFAGQYLVLKKLKNDFKESRFGFSISTKISKKATDRNKIKRRLSEVIRLNIKNIKAGQDIVLVSKKDILEKDYQSIKDDLLKLIKKAKLSND